MEKELKEIAYQLQVINKNLEKIIDKTKKAKNIIKEQNDEGRNKQLEEQ